MTSDMPQISALISAIESHMNSIREHAPTSAVYNESRVRVIAALTGAFQAGPHGLGESGMLAIEIVELAMKLPPQPKAATRFPLPHATLADCIIILRRIADAPDGAQLDGAWPAEYADRANAARYTPRPMTPAAREAEGVYLARAVDLPEVVVRRE